LNDKNGVLLTTKLLPGVAQVSLKNEGIGEINYGNCIAASRPYRIIPGTLSIGGLNDKNGVYLTIYLLAGVVRFSIKNEGTREYNNGNFIAASRPDRITPCILWIGGSNDKDGVYPTTQLLICVARFSIKNEGTRHY
jgi:hypothetical protein